MTSNTENYYHNDAFVEDALISHRDRNQCRVEKRSMLSEPIVDENGSIQYQFTFQSPDRRPSKTISNLSFQSPVNMLNYRHSHGIQ